MTPQRIQLRRTKGWKMPPNTVKVDRTTRWGNRYLVGKWGLTRQRFGSPPIPPTAENCVAWFRSYAENKAFHERDWLEPLRGKNLACWCKPGEPCHADVLLELANQ